MYVSKECTPRVVETALTWTLAQQERDEPIPDPPENDLGELICEYEEFVEPNMLYDLKPWDDCSEHWLDADWYIDTPQGIDESRFQELLGEMVREPSAYPSAPVAYTQHEEYHEWIDEELDGSEEGEKLTDSILASVVTSMYAKDKEQFFAWARKTLSKSR